VSKLMIFNLLWPACLLFVAYWIYKNPVWDIGASNGYATKQSCQSQEKWDYAQLEAPGIYSRFGFGLLVLWSILTLVHLITKWSIVPFITLLLSFIVGIACYLYMENLIDKNNPSSF
jgi:hypothetical protein